MSIYFEALSRPFYYFFEVQQRIYWNNLLVAFLFAVILYLLNRKKNDYGVILGIFRFIFPKTVYLHKSAINDYVYFFTNTLLITAFITPLFSLLTFNVSILINESINNNFDITPLDIFSKGNKVFLIFGFTLIFALVNDFAIFFTHYLQHRIPFLWEFHKVHHSAQVLTPITVYRMHPVDNLLTFSFSGISLGIAFGLLRSFLKDDIIIFNIAGTNLIFIIFYIFAYNLRHSHIWLSYGPYLSYLLISPAQHQIHHSSDSKHFNKNLGFIFALWDHLFGTLYIPKQKENIHFGLSQNEDKEFINFWSLYLMPIKNLIIKFQPSDLYKPKKHLSILVFISIVAPAIYLSDTQPINDISKDELFIENMTWQEIKQAIADKKTTVLIPTGGTEQNGPHLILGKHNYIIKYTAQEIAKKLGNTLIAPVMAYVPEGNITPPEGHMRFPGTLSITETEFSQLLESTVKSLKAHGFKVIVFVGESGGNQASQENVARKLDNLWRNENIRVINASDYYSNNHQINYLKNEGFTMSQIGGHAGIRDTSELMAVYPNGIRPTLLADNTNNNILLFDADGDATKANKELGKILLGLKIKAAVNQIRLILNQVSTSIK